MVIILFMVFFCSIIVVMLTIIAVGIAAISENFDLADRIILAAKYAMLADICALCLFGLLKWM